MTLAEWINAWTRDGHGNGYIPILTHAPAVGIHDTAHISHGRTWLWGLSDYRVESATGGVIWLAPR